MNLICRIHSCYNMNTYFLLSVTFLCFRWKVWAKKEFSPGWWKQVSKQDTKGSVHFFQDFLSVKKHFDEPVFKQCRCVGKERFKSLSIEQIFWACKFIVCWFTLTYVMTDTFMFSIKLLYIFAIKKTPKHNGCYLYIPC